MKKFIFSLFLLSITITSQCMYHQGRKLKYTQVKLSNKSSIPMKLVWVEVQKGRQINIVRNIKPGEVISVKLGEIGDYSQSKPAKIIYNPIPRNAEFKQEFYIDLPNSKAFGLTAVKLADILNNILIPGVLKADDEGNFRSFQYMNMQHPSQWGEAMKAAGAVKTIK